jgi:hypothetical protein
LSIVFEVLQKRPYTVSRDVFDQESVDVRFGVMTNERQQ